MLDRPERPEERPLPLANASREAVPNTIVKITRLSVKRFIVLFPYLSYQNAVNDRGVDLAVPNCVAGHMPACFTQREPRKCVTGNLRKNKSPVFQGFSGRKVD